MINVRKLFKRKKKRRNQYLNIKQSGDTLYISGHLNTQTDTVSELWLKCRETEEWFSAGEIKPSAKF